MKLKDCVKKLFTLVILKPFSFAISSLSFLIFFLLFLHLMLPKLNLYVSIRESIVNLGKTVNIEIKKKNELSLLIGHSDSSQGLKEDKYEISLSNIDDFSPGIWFGIKNPNEEDIYKNVRLFIQFVDENRKIDGKGAIDSGWIKFKDNYFNFGVIEKIIPSFVVQTNSIAFKFPEYGNYNFKFAIYADGYKAASGSKTIIVKK